MYINKIGLILITGFLFITSCYRIKPSRGGGQSGFTTPRSYNTNHIQLPDGYEIALVAKNLNFPSGLTFDENNQLYYIEAGYSYGEKWTAPRLLRLDTTGKSVEISKGDKNGPWNGVDFYQGNFYISEGGTLEGGRILRVDQSGKITRLVENLPGYGDHHTNGPVINDGYIYFAQGTATNSGIVGNDNADFGWLKRKKEFHDIPCQDMVLAGTNYESDNVFTDKKDKIITGAFLPYGTASTEGQVIKDSVPCSGAIMRIPVSGGNMELVASGFRNPFGMSISHDGRLFITENSYDSRGSRPVWGAGDVLWEIKPGRWYGWPDYSAGKPISNDEEFKKPGENKVLPLLKRQPDSIPKPSAILAVHSSSAGLDFSKNIAFGYAGQAFIAQFGDMAPKVGKVMAPVGFKIVRVNPETGVITDFAANEGRKNGPASWLDNGGLERPVAVKFDRKGEALYIVDFGQVKALKAGIEPVENTGCIWKITKRK